MLLPHEPSDAACRSGSSRRTLGRMIEAGLAASARGFAEACGFEPSPGRTQVLPDASGAIAAVLFGIEPPRRARRTCSCRPPRDISSERKLSVRQCAT